MNFYKLREPSRSYVNGESNVYTREDVLLWAEDINRMDDLELDVVNNIELAIDILDSYNEFLTKVI